MDLWTTPSSRPVMQHGERERPTRLLLHRGASGGDGGCALGLSLAKVAAAQNHPIVRAAAEAAMQGSSCALSDALERRISEGGLATAALLESHDHFYADVALISPPE